MDINTDPHVALRSRALLPASSAQGEVRIHTMAVYLGGQASIVARRRGDARWSVSKVELIPGSRRKIWTSTYRLSRERAIALEALLDSGDLQAPASEEPCLDPVGMYVETDWKGTKANVSSNGCETDSVLDQLWRLLSARD
ncbi:MAG: hypothetical protein WAL33_05045 [Caulobacter sp.]